MNSLILTKKLRSTLGLSITGLSAIAMSGLLFISTPSIAAESADNVEKKASVKVPAMRNRVYSQLARAQKLADEGMKIEAIEVLDNVKDQLDSLNSYERAMLWNFYAFIYYGNEDFDNAIKSFESVVKEEAIPNSLRLSTLYSLAQLSMQQDDYQGALKYLGQWKNVNEKELTNSQHVLFAQVHYQLKNYKESLAYVSDAVAMTEQAGDVPKENWLILQRANFYEMKMPNEVTLVLEKLVRFHDKPQYWIQLAGMYGEIAEEVKQLAVMESAYQAGYITKSQEVISLVQLYRYHGAPIKAANLLEKSFSNGQVVAEEKYLEMLAQSYVAAKEDEKAIPVLKDAAKIAETGKYDAQLAQSFLNLEQWEAAINSASEAIKRGGIDNVGTMHLVIGMGQFNLKAFDEALKAFDDAQKNADTAKMAKQWYSYVEREQGNQAQLAMIQ